MNENEAPPDEGRDAVEPSPASPAADPDVLAMDDALERGDHAEARALAARLAASDEPSRRDAGLATLDRLKPDAGVVVVLVTTGLLIAALALTYLGPRAYGGH